MLRKKSKSNINNHISLFQHAIQLYDCQSMGRTTVYTIKYAIDSHFMRLYSFRIRLEKKKLRKETIWIRQYCSCPNTIRSNITRIDTEWNKVKTTDWRMCVCVCVSQYNNIEKAMYFAQLNIEKLFDLILSIAVYYIFSIFSW